MMNSSSKYNLGLVLSGGGTRGYAHLGVLKYLEEQHIFPDIISGTSAGALAAALYSSGKSIDEIMTFLAKQGIRKVIGFELPGAGLINLQKLVNLLEKFTGVSTFEELDRPISVAITNLSTGEVEYRSSGVLWPWVLASCSVPMVFKAYKTNDHVYSDGGILCNFPAKIIREKTQKLIGVDLMPKVLWKNKSLNSFKGIGLRVFELSIWDNSRAHLDLCDQLISLDELRYLGIFDFNKAYKIYQKGYDKAKIILSKELDEVGVK